MEVSSYLYQSPYSSPVQYGRLDTSAQKNEEQQSSDKLNDANQSSQNMQNPLSAKTSATSQTTTNITPVVNTSALDIYA